MSIGNRIVDSMKESIAISCAEIPEKSYRVHIPERMDVKAIRSRLGLTQASFAASFGLSLYTLRNWEQGKRQPEPAARAYLKVIENAPDIVRNILIKSHM